MTKNVANMNKKEFEVWIIEYRRKERMKVIGEQLYFWSMASLILLNIYLFFKGILWP